MTSILGTIFAFVIVFGVLVFVHEFGHFFMAKLVGINVEVFSFGYGKRLFGFKKKGTDYRISLIPMGGYVRFAGEEAALEGLKSGGEVKPGDYLAAKRWQRFLVILCGPVMNLILAFLLVAVINMVGVDVAQWLDKTPVIGWIEPDSPAAKADLKIDDTILSINGDPTPTWHDVEMAVVLRPEKTIQVEIDRGGEVRIVDLLTESITRFQMGYAGFYGKVQVQVNMVLANQPAEIAGLQAGDVVTAINGEPIYYYQFIELLEKSPEQELDFLVERGSESLHLTVIPRKEGEIGKIGIYHTARTSEKKFGFFAAFAESYESNRKLLFAVFDFLKNLVIGEASTRQLGGPIEIANVSYAMFRLGFIAMLSWIAFISLQLGIINLFPVPVFDGGQILVLGLEGAARRDFPPKVKQIIMQIGFVIFIFLVVFILLNDVVKRLPNGWSSIIPF
ncbi:MAG: RIP metalloprotease RseP [Candidatus Aminicenantaceae bacterium]